MTLNASESLVGANGRVYVAPAGTASPSTSTSALSADWIELGFTTAEGVQFQVTRNFVDVESWQTAFPIRKLNTTITGKVMTKLIQFNEITLPLALGGGTISETSGAYTFTPAPAGTIDERALVVEWNDNGKHYRIYVSRVVNSESVDIALTRTNVATLPLGFDILGSNDGSPPFTWLTDDANWAV